MLIELEVLIEELVELVLTEVDVDKLVLVELVEILVLVEVDEDVLEDVLVVVGCTSRSILLAPSSCNI